jgi:gluconolactonase
MLSGTPMQIAGVPPSDAFNNNNNNFTNVEGALWLDGALYVSEIGSGPQPPARVLKIDSAGGVTIAIPDSATNGLAANASGELFGALHGKPGTGGSISKLSLTGGAAVPLIATFDNKNFNSPNDLAIHSNGTIYFSDPDYQAPSMRPQDSTRVYRLPPGATAAVAIESLNAPNGVTLSPAQDWLYVSGGQLKKYPVTPDGTVGAGADFLPGGGGGGDGMVVDCAGNLYVTQDKSVKVYSKDGAPLGTVDVTQVGGSVTNVAFGGPERKTLFITGQGAGSGKGVFKLELNLPGFPY